ncbi:MAG TPA: FHA domain-containing protein [Rhodanobacteraceae bacterium]|nr:FHA domain-containing protein [Rhodanobacteraceae bacterium]
MSGKLLPVENELALGGSGPVLSGLAPSCSLAIRDGELVLEARGSGVAVNGVTRTRAKLASGDQLTLGEHRFVVEAPGLQADRVAAQVPVELPPITAPPEEPRGTRAEFGWLLGTAALLAGIIALLLWWKH